MIKTSRSQPACMQWDRQKKIRLGHPDVVSVERVRQDPREGITNIEACGKFKIGDQFIDRGDIGECGNTGIEFWRINLAASTAGVFCYPATSFDTAASTAVAEFWQPMFTVITDAIVSLGKFPADDAGRWQGATNRLQYLIKHLSFSSQLVSESTVLVYCPLGLLSKV